MSSRSEPRRFAWLIERLNHQALRLTQPGSRWASKAVLIGLSVKALGVMISVLPAVLIAITAGTLDAPDDMKSAMDPLKGVVAGLLLAPAIETLQIVLVFRLFLHRFGTTAFVSCNAILAGLLHISDTSWFRLDAIFAFAVMSYQYVSFREHIGRGRAYWGVALTHATSNGVALTVALITG